MGSDDAAFDALTRSGLRRRQRIGERCRTGLPPMDALYFDAPSPDLSARIGGAIRGHAARAPGTPFAIRHPRHPVASFSETVARLKAEHRPGYWYRGQRTTRDCTYRLAHPALRGFAGPAGPAEIVFDAVMPSAFRPFTEARPARWEGFAMIPLLDRMAPAVRAIMRSDETRLHKLVVEALDDALIEFMQLAMASRMTLTRDQALLTPGTTAPHALLDLISLSQHYGYGSVMVDVTREIDVAAWFASRDWQTGAVAGSPDGSPGMIYRFDAAPIQVALDTHIAAKGGGAPRFVQMFGIFGLADISARFPFLARPAAQAGGSLLGMENLLTHFLMQDSAAMALFPFEHAGVTGRETPRTLEDIRPAADPGLAAFPPDLAEAGHPIEPEELRAFLDRAAPAKRDHIVAMRRLGVI